MRFRLPFILNVLLIIFAFCLTASAQMPVLLNGVLSVLYGDNPDNPQMHYLLNTTDGRTFELEISPEVLADAGGITALMGAQVSVTLDSSAQATRLDPDMIYRASSITIQQTQRESESGRMVSGALSWVNLMCKFSGDSSAPYTQAQVTGFFANSAPLLDHYYRQNSYNLVTTNVTTLNWQTLPRTRAQYLALASPGRLTTLFNECAALHAGAVTFNNFYGINMFFNNSFDGSYWGSSCTNTTLQGVTKCWRTTWLPYYGGYDISAYAHEMGHAFGLPHSNNSDGDSDPYDNPYDVMSGLACQIYDNTYGCQQPNTILYHKDLLDWIAPERFFSLSTNGTFSITLDRIAKPTSTNYYGVIVPISASRAITIEARRNEFGAYDNALHNAGVIIHDINTSRAEPAWMVNGVSDGAAFEGPGVFEVGETFTDFVNGYSMTVSDYTPDGYAISLYKGPLGSPPDLGVTVQSSMVSAGKAIVTLRVRNNGTGAATRAYLAIDPPFGTYVNTITGSPGCYKVESFILNSYLCELNNRQPLAPGAQIDVAIDLRPSELTALSFPAVSASNEAETNTANDRVTVNTALTTALPDMNLQITPSVSTVNLNQNVTHTYLLRDLGGVSGESITLNATLPAGMTLQGWSWDIFGFWENPACAQNGNGVTCTLDSLGPTYEFGTYFSLEVTSKGVQNGSHTVSGSVTVSGTDATPADNTAQATVGVGQAALTGTVTFQSRPAAPNSLLSMPVLVRITRVSDSAQFFYEYITTDNMGRFTVNNLPPGNYNVWVKGAHTLSNLVSATLVAGNNNVNIGTLKEGDANDDNTVSLSDFSLLASSFGKSTGEVGFDARADFNGDGLITLTDFSLLASNYGQSGQN